MTVENACAATGFGRRHAVGSRGQQNGPGKCANTHRGLTAPLDATERNGFVKPRISAPRDNTGEARRPLYTYTSSGNRRRTYKPHPALLRRMRALVWGRDNYTCLSCGYTAPEGERPGQLTLDHVIPYAAGGKFTEDNLQTLCLRCNMRKGAKV